MEKEKNTIVYYTDEGFIVAATGGWEDETLSSKYNTLTVEVANLEASYVEDGVLKDKLEWTPLVQNNSIVNIPETSRVYVEGKKLKVTDGVLELDKHPFHKVNVLIDSATHFRKEITL